VIVPLFARYIGIDYSGAQTPSASLPSLRIYLAEGDALPVEVAPQGKKSSVRPSQAYRKDTACIVFQCFQDCLRGANMRPALSIFMLVTALSVSTPARAQQNGDLGKLEYEKGCIGCHGVTAKGGGVHTPRLKNDPPDLTVLSKASGGVFPIQKIYEVIDGRAQMQAHGSREMPSGERNTQRLK
jgi:hypothetical protein